MTSNAQPSAAASAGDSASSLGYVALTRFAAQQLYAPARLLHDVPAIRRVPVSREPVNLVRGGAIQATPLVAWRAGGYYLTGDVVKRYADGYFWFVGRDDDVINTGGHLVGPFEIESALIEHEAVAEAGVFGHENLRHAVDLGGGVTGSGGRGPGARTAQPIRPRDLSGANTMPITKSHKRALVIAAAGLSALVSIGRQEDPTITNIFATVTTAYPGAEPARVEALVTD